MKRYDVVELAKGKDGFYDGSLPMIPVMTNVDAESANSYMMYHLEYWYYAIDTETGEMFHGTTNGLRSVNSY